MDGKNNSRAGSWVSKRSPLVTVILALAGFLLLAGCSFAPLGRTGVSSASIEIRMKQPAGAITSIALIVTGPDMAPIARTLPPGSDEATVQVPAGSSRAFSLLVNTATLTFRGDATVDLAAGESRTITLEPVLTSTPIVVPDSYNNRIVQLTDFTGSGWVARTGSDIGYANDSDFQPYDVDFDSRGRILVANSNNTSGGVIRLDSIDDTTYEVVSASTGPVVALAVDRVRGYLYYCTGSNPLRRRTLDPLGTEETFDVSSEPELAGNFATTSIAVDDAGLVYITNNLGPAVAKLDLSRAAGSRVVATYTSNLSQPWDLLLKGPYVYLTDPGAATGYLFTRLDMNLAYVDSFGKPVSVPDPAPKEFWGPTRFVATLSRKVTIIDESDSAAYNRLVSFNAPDGSNWESYGASGAGVGQFHFYNFY